MNFKLRLCMIFAVLFAAMGSGSVYASSLDPNTFSSATIWNMNSSFPSTAYYGESRYLMKNAYTGVSPYLILGQAVAGGGGIYEPQMTVGSQGQTGLSGDEALQFDGVNDVAHSLDGHKVWNDNWEDFQIEFYFKPDRVLGDAQEIVSAPYTWSIMMVPGETNCQLQFICWLPDNSQVKARSQNFDGGIIGQWNQVIATAIDGVISITLNGVAGQSTASYDTLQTSLGGRVYVGANLSNVRFYDGLLDDLTISDRVYSDYLEPFDDAVGTQVLLHFDEVGNLITPDDGSASPMRNNYGILQGNASLSSSGINSLFNNSIDFDGGAVFVGSGTKYYGIDWSNVKVECWAKFEAAKPTAANIMYPLFSFPSALRLSFLTVADGRLRLQYDVWGNGAVLERIEVPTPYLTYDFVCKWNHYAVEFENGYLRLFINNTLYTAVAGTYTNPAPYTVLSNPTAEMRVATEANSARRFYGKIDEVRVSKVSLVCGDLSYLAADINKDCTVDPQDLTDFAENWLKCSDPSGPDCQAAQ